MRKRVIGGLVAATLAAAVAALTLLVTGAAGDNGHGRHHHGSKGNGQTGYHFLVFDAVSGTSDRMIIDGTGSFNKNEAHGGGSFDHFQTGATLPLHIVASGTWKRSEERRVVQEDMTRGEI